MAEMALEAASTSPTPTGCRNGTGSDPLSHDLDAIVTDESESTSMASDTPNKPIADLPNLNLEVEMLTKGSVNIYAVDEKSFKGDKLYVVASNGVPRKDQCVSAKFAYNKIRSSVNAHSAIGIDLEGTSLLQVGEGGVALMVQVSTESEIVVEYPRGSCSVELRQLLNDSTITKVFCGVEGDEQHLGCSISGPIVDIEAMAVERFGPTKTKRGLTKILSLASKSVWEKRSIKKEKWFYFSTADAMIKCRKHFAQYAAADAWGTLLAFNMLMGIPVPDEQPPLQPLSTPPPQPASLQQKQQPSSTLPIQTIQHSQQVCHFFLKNKCRNGANCHFMHTKPPPALPVTGKSNGNSGGKRSSCYICGDSNHFANKCPNSSGEGGGKGRGGSGGSKSGGRGKGNRGNNQKGEKGSTNSNSSPLIPNST